MDGLTGIEPELCDLCGVVIRDDSQLYALVPERGGVTALSRQRLITACSADHLAQLQRDYQT